MSSGGTSSPNPSTQPGGTDQTAHCHMSGEGRGGMGGGERFIFRVTYFYTEIHVHSTLALKKTE